MEYYRVIYKDSKGRMCKLIFAEASNSAARDRVSSDYNAKEVISCFRVMKPKEF